MGRINSRGALALLVLIMCAGRHPLAAQSNPEITITLESDTSFLVQLVQLDPDRRFMGAIHDGFPLYIEYHVELRESRGIWFDNTASEQVVEFVVSYDPVREVYVVDDQEKTEELRSEVQLRDYIGRVYRFEFTSPPRGRYYYAVTVDARTLSDADVDEVYDWLRGDDADVPKQRGILTRAARRLLIEVAPLPRWNGRAESRRIEFQ
jgi:hypothetical protein